MFNGTIYILSQIGFSLSIARDLNFTTGHTEQNDLKLDRLP
jgi:hypothetical protein